MEQSDNKSNFLWKQYSCAMQGRKHIKENIPCQDKTKICFRNNTYVIALADGAGSARCSHYGAEIVVSSVCEFITDHFDELLQDNDALSVKTKILNYILDRLNNEAINKNCTINDMASTLLFVAIKNDVFFVCHIGDGVIGYLKNGELKLISSPENEEFANVTFFVTSKQAPKYTKIFRGKTDGVSGFFLMSDGTSNCLYEKKSHRFSKIITKIMQRIILIDENEANRLINKYFNVIVEETETGDDCSISLICRETDILKHYKNLSFAEKCELFALDDSSDNNEQEIINYDNTIKYMDKYVPLRKISKYLGISHELFLSTIISNLQELGFIKLLPYSKNNKILYCLNKLFILLKIRKEYILNLNMC